MIFYLIRLKNHPEKYVGKVDPTYAVSPDQDERELQLDAHWFVPQAKAKVWTSTASLRRFLALCRHRSLYPVSTFTRYELVCVETTVPGSKVCTLDYDQLKTIKGGKRAHSDL